MGQKLHMVVEFEDGDAVLDFNSVNVKINAENQPELYLDDKKMNLTETNRFGNFICVNPEKKSFLINSELIYKVPSNK